MIATAAVAALAAAGGLSAPARAQVPVLHLDGRGWGHGVGLAQVGAMYAALAGADAATILATFYPGTGLGTAGGLVRVAVHAGPSTTLAFPDGGQLQAPDLVLDVPPGGRVAVRPSAGGWQVDGVVVGRSTSAPVLTSAATPEENCLPLFGPCTTAPECLLGCAPAPTTAVPPTTAPPDAPPDAPPPEAPASPADPGPADPAPAPPPPPPVTAGPLTAVPIGVTEVVDRGRQYRGVVHVLGDPAGLRLVNELDVEAYLKGMAEVPSTWPAAAQQAQAIAARTYVLRAMAASGEVCDYDRCQVYVGATREAPGQSAAVDATRGVVLTYGGALAAAVYSADAGGVTATPAEGFGPGSGDYPYLTTVRYATPDPLPWAADVALGEVGGRLGYPGTLTGVRVAATGPSGRAVQVALDGTAGERVVDGRTFARRLGLRSTLFTAAVGSSAAPSPLPPPLEDDAMAPPDDAAALSSAVAATAGRGDRPSPRPEELAAAVPSAWEARRTTRPGPDGSRGSRGDRSGAAAVAVAALAAATALAVAQAGGPAALLGGTSPLGSGVSRGHPRSPRSSPRGGRRRGRRRPGRSSAPRSGG